MTPPVSPPAYFVLAIGPRVATGGSFPAPLALQFWRTQVTQRLPGRAPITGGEIHAYLTAQALRRRALVPIPDVWLVMGF
jgi:hypothetical protein